VDRRFDGWIDKWIRFKFKGYLYSTKGEVEERKKNR